MKKLLIIGIFLSGTAFGAEVDQKSWSTITNMTGKTLRGSTNSQRGIYNVSERYINFGSRIIKFEPGKPLPWNFESIRFGGVKKFDDLLTELWEYTSEDKVKVYVAKFVSDQENGKKYLLMENKWDKETDFVFISEDDLKKPEWQY